MSANLKKFIEIGQNLSLSVYKLIIFTLPFHAAAVMVPVAEFFYRPILMGQNLLQRSENFVEYQNTIHFYKIIFFVVFCGLLSATYIAHRLLSNSRVDFRLDAVPKFLKVLLTGVSAFVVLLHVATIGLVLLGGYSFATVKLSFWLGISFLVAYFFYLASEIVKRVFGLSSFIVLSNLSMVALACFIIVWPLVSDRVLNIEGATVTDDVPDSFMSYSQRHYGARLNYRDSDFYELYTRLVNPRAVPGVSDGVVYTAALSDEQKSIVTANMASWTNLDKALSIFARPYLTESTFMIRLDGENFRTMCYLVNYPMMRNSPPDISSCFEFAGRYSYASGIDRRAFINKYIDGDNLGVANAALDMSLANENAIERIAKKYQIERRDLRVLDGFTVSATRGLYFHHYQNILSGIYSRHDFKSLPWSQYGLGVGSIVLLVAETTKLGYFDSLLAAVVMVNLFLLFMVVYLERTIILSQFSLPVFGLLVGVSATYLSSELIAPALFPIRVFPHILILLYVLYSVGTRSPNTRDWLAMGALLGVSFFYNFEYAALLATALCCASLASLPLRSSAFFAIFVALCVSALALQSMPETSSVASYFTGIGIPPYPGRVEAVALLSALAFGIVLLVAPSAGGVERTFSSISLTLFFLFCCVKFWWNSSLNHFGLPLMFLFFALALRARARQYSGLATLTGSSVNNLVTCAAVALALMVSVSSWLNYIGYLGDQRFRDYSRSSVSQFRELDVRMLEVAADFESRREEVLRGGRLSVIGPFEWFLSVYYQKPLNSPYPDFNTSVMIRGSLDKITQNFVLTKTPAIAVEKTIVKPPISFLPVSTYYDGSPFGEHLALSDGLIDLRSLVTKIRTDGGYTECGESRFFVYFCRDYHSEATGRQIAAAH